MWFSWLLLCWRADSLFGNGVDLNHVYKRCGKAKGGLKGKVKDMQIGLAEDRKIGLENGDFRAVGNFIEKRS